MLKSEQATRKGLFQLARSPYGSAVGLKYKDDVLFLEVDTKSQESETSVDV